MLTADVVVAGGGVSGLLIASALAPSSSVILLEQTDEIPRNKYWLTDEQSVTRNVQLKDCVDRRYRSLDFVAYDGLTARVNGDYCLWDTDKLVSYLLKESLRSQATVLTGHRLYSLSDTKDGLVVRANSKVIRARLLVDCMGFGSPLVGAKDIATIIGYYVLHGCEVATIGDVEPIALDNVVIDKRPAFLELFPTSRGTAHAALILPSRDFRSGRSIRGELSFILRKSHYSERVVWNPSSTQRSYFGIIPVGRLHTPALDHIVFFGEAGQSNPAASATGLTRMLHIYRDLASSIGECLRKDELKRRHLLHAIPRYMTRMNRAFQESLFENILTFTSDDFRGLVQDLREFPDDLVNDLIFAEFDFSSRRFFRFAFDSIRRPRSVVGKHLIKSIAKYFRAV
jgi:flavin-dependent dehydrogenase